MKKICIQLLAIITCIMTPHIMQTKNKSKKHGAKEEIHSGQKPHCKGIETPQQALEEILQGNQHFASTTNRAAKKGRKKVADKQYPFAVVLTCSDSRLSPEIVFDQLDLGSLFVIRNAGNIADKTAIGSIEYAIAHLDSLLIIVLGHERCGAVMAAVDVVVNKEPIDSVNITNIIDMITPAVKTTLKGVDKNHILSQEEKDMVIHHSIEENVKNHTKKLYKNSKIIKQAIDDNKVKIVGAYYDLDSGKVTIID